MTLAACGITSVCGAYWIDSMASAWGEDVSEPNNLAATVFVYRSKDTGQIRCHYAHKASALDSSPERQQYDHIATLEPRLWIQNTTTRKDSHDTRS